MAIFDPEEDLSELLNLLSRKQLVELLLSAASSDPSTLSNIHRAVDADPSHRDLYVTGFRVDVPVNHTKDSLCHCLFPFGEIDSVYVPVGENGQPYGYGFIMYRHLASAKKALKEPHKHIDDGRTTIFYSHRTLAREIYVRNLPPRNFSELITGLSEFFMQYGEIEEVRTIFDLMSNGPPQTSVCFLYETLEGAVRAFEEPRKIFEGHILICEKEEFRSRTSGPNARVIGASPRGGHYVPNFGMGGGYGGFNYPNAGAISTYPSAYHVPGMGGGYGGFSYPNAGAIGTYPTAYYVPGTGGGYGSFNYPPLMWVQTAPRPHGPAGDY